MNIDSTNEAELRNDGCSSTYSSSLSNSISSSSTANVCLVLCSPSSHLVDALFCGAIVAVGFVILSDSVDLEFLFAINDDVDADDFRVDVVGCFLLAPPAVPLNVDVEDEAIFEALVDFLNLILFELVVVAFCCCCCCCCVGSAEDEALLS